MLIHLLFIFILWVLYTENVTSVAFLFSVLTLFLYVIPYYTLWDTFIELDYIEKEGSSRFFAYITLCYSAFIIGHRLYSPDGAEHKYMLSMGARLVTHREKFERYSIIAGIIGLLNYGFFVVHSGAGYFMGHQSGDFSVGGYVYEQRFFVFSAVLLLYNAYLYKTISSKGVQFLIGISVLLVLDAYLQQQRGSWIRFGVIFMLSYLFNKNSFTPVTVATLFRRYKPVFIAGLFLWLLLTFTVQVRKFYGPDVPILEQVQSTVNLIMEEPDVLFGGSGISEGNEFVTAYNSFNAAETAKKYDYGVKWLYGFINFVPRVWWQGKPRWSTFSINEFEVTEKYGTKKNPEGAALTGMVDTYFRFSWYAVFFFLAAGYYVKKLYVASYYDIRYRFFYICLYMGCFYFITQDMFPLVAFTLYLYIPVYVVSRLCFTVRGISRAVYETPGVRT